MLLQDGGSDARSTDVASIAERAFGRPACFVDAGVGLVGESVEARWRRAERSAEDVGDGDVGMAGLGEMVALVKTGGMAEVGYMGGDVSIGLTGLGR